MIARSLLSSVAFVSAADTGAFINLCAACRSLNTRIASLERVLQGCYEYSGRGDCVGTGGPGRIDTVVLD